MPLLIVGCCYGRRWWDTLITAAEAPDPDLVRPLPTHSYVRGADWAVEAVPPRVRRFAPDYNPHPQVREYALDVPEGPYLTARALAEGCVGRLYNVAGLAACVLYEWTGLALPTLVRWRFCSQLAVEVIRAAGCPVLGSLPDDAVTPARLEAWLVAAGATRLNDAGTAPVAAPRAAYRATLHLPRR